MSEHNDSPSIKAAVAAAEAKGETQELTAEQAQEFAETQPSQDSQPETSTGNAPPSDDHTGTSQTEG